MSFFKAYDMRGTFGIDFDLATVRAVGEALPRVVSGGRWLVGRDARLTSADVRDALVDGLVAAGVSVTDLGLCTTSMIYAFTALDGYDGSVMVTASHNPPGDNGLKVSRRGALPVGYADGLNEVERLVTGRAVCPKPPGAVPGRTVCPKPPAPDYLRRYVELQRKLCAFDGAGLKYAVDCSNGMSALLVRELFPGAKVINADIDGRFPAHSPNPLKPEARAELSALVRAEHLDCGIIFDGDAARAMFVDERGEFVQSDYLIPVVARATRRGNAAAKTVLHDVRTSRGAIETLREEGFEPVMVPVGHAFAKPKMREHGALCGGELAGHYYFGDFFNCDSGVLAARRVMEEIALHRREGRTFSQMMLPIVSRYANSGELNYRVEDKDAAIQRTLAAAEKFGEITGRSDLDGVRLEFADGWLNVRKSNTEPYLRLLVEAKSEALLSERVRELEAAIQSN